MGTDDKILPMTRGHGLGLLMRMTAAALGMCCTEEQEQESIL